MLGSCSAAPKMPPLPAAMETHTAPTDTQQGDRKRKTCCLHLIPLAPQEGHSPVRMGIQGQFIRQGSGDSSVLLFTLSPAGGTKLLRSSTFSPQVTYTEGISTDQGKMIPQPIFLCQLYCLFLTASCHQHLFAKNKHISNAIHYLEHQGKGNLFFSQEEIFLRDKLVHANSCDLHSVHVVPAETVL